MKIKINDTITVTPIITQTSTCPAGTAYYEVDYQVDGITICTAFMGPMWGSPNPIALLDADYEYTVYQAPDVDHPVRGTCNGKQMWWETRHTTHRQRIIDAMAQVVTV